MFSDEVHPSDVHSPALLAFKLVHRAQDMTESASCLEIQKTLGLQTSTNQQ